ncbi:hypothetical protein BBO99_00009452 [Phytophthora kernoviae]|uniref:Uncharacterized protein n=2 Tax=Phytophthora kernoviae TaxID=325452 RepID=A0A3R7JUJ7_9STRA|nr:hypothetical protein G195_010921 [Phytophthora kernoviae 00238/432]KAG2504617.1 hypothetical protein JM16_009166 [Phytophthora kernoviae]KAG2506877.1 hypothetical protein JM18_008758 [Phytophthora kernoviae]RLN27217.1 hypothetical protein BBI17_009311 [Phytophthora kernoviae]RLN73392.1 hypothetical protein BBO99_00009452 [Phytophthora kernoviae]
MNLNNGNMPMDVNAMGLMDYNSLGTMPLMGAGAAGDPTNSFVDQLQDGGSNQVLGLDGTTYEVNDLTAKNRNRGNYRCSKCGEPKKGHVCPLVPSNYKCNRCGLSKKASPSMRTIGVQVEMDEDMTTRVLDLSLQGVVEFHKTVVGYASPPVSSGLETAL